MFDTLKRELHLVEVAADLLNTEMVPLGEVNWEPEDKVCPSCGHQNCFRIKHEGDNFTSFARCFSEGTNWDVTGLASLVWGVKPYQAAKRLASEYGIVLPSSTSPMQELFNLVAEYYHQSLQETGSQTELGGKTPVEYQQEVRGHKFSTLQENLIGWSDGHLLDYLDSMGVDKAIIQESGMVNKRGQDFFQPKLFIYPHFVGKNVSHFTLKDPLKRVQYQLAKKYSLNDIQFYGQQTLANIASGPTIIVEGENDLLSVIERGHTGPVIGTDGQISKRQLEWIASSLKGRDVITIFDPDAAGDLYREKLGKLKSSFNSIKQIKLRIEDEDIDKYLRDGGDLQACLAGNSESCAVDLANSGISDSEEDDVESSLIEEKAGCYYKVRFKDGEPYLHKISNFTIKLHNIYIKGNEREREILIKRFDGKTSAPIKVTSDAKVSLKPFKTLVANAVDASFYGREEDMTSLWEHVYKTSNERVIYLTDGVGRLDEFNGWLFGDCFLSDSGARYNPDESGSIWLGHRDIGVKPLSIVSSNGGVESTSGIPRIGNALSSEEIEDLLKLFIQNLGRNLGNYGNAVMCIAWIWATVYSNVLIRKYGVFPFLFVWGKTRGGKSTIMGWLMSLLNMSDYGAITVKTYGSGVSFGRKLAYYHSLPMCIDEFRRDQPSIDLYPALRSWYDRVPVAVSDMKSSFSIIERKVNATIMCSGEDHFSDPAVRNRCISVRLAPEEQREMRETYTWIENYKSDFPSIGMQWIIDSATTDKAAIIADINTKIDTLKDLGINSRTAIIWAMIWVFGQKLCDKYNPDFDFSEHIKLATACDVEEQDEDDTLNKFWEVIEGLQTEDRPRINGDNIRREGGELYVWFPEVFRQFDRSLTSSVRESFSANAIRELIREQDYYVEAKDNRRPMGMKGVQRRVMIFDLNQVPEVLQRIAEAAGV